MLHAIFLTASLAAAGPGAPTSATPPARLGLCAACHGRDGMARVPGAPHLAGQRADYLIDALKQYRDGRREHKVMQTVLGPLAVAEFEALAIWYAAQSPCAVAP